MGGKTARVVPDQFIGWAWVRDVDYWDMEGVQGPYSTREEAMEAAEATELDGEFVFGKLVHANPVNCVYYDAPAMLEVLENQSWFYGYRPYQMTVYKGNDAFFELRDGAKAEEELNELLRQWAAKWVLTKNPSFIPEDDPGEAE